MEGVLIVIKAWGLAALMIWVHRRFFERVARPEPEFEAWCKRGPEIAALWIEPSHVAEVEATLRKQLGKRARVIATLGGWPWPNYELELRVFHADGVLRLAIARAELRKTQGTPAPSLIFVLRELLNLHAASARDVWLLPETVYGVSGPSEAPRGWTVLAGDEPRPRVRPREHAPGWLVRAAEPKADANAGAAAAPGPDTSPKLLALPREC